MRFGSLDYQTSITGVWPSYVDTQNWQMARGSFITEDDVKSYAAVIVLGLWFVLQLVDGVASLGAESSAGGVAFFAHIGGFVLGVVVGLILRVTGVGAGRRGPSPGPMG